MNLNSKKSKPDPTLKGALCSYQLEEGLFSITKTLTKDGLFSITKTLTKDGMFSITKTLTKDGLFNITKTLTKDGVTLLKH